MKNICLPSLYLCATALVISACTLEKEPEIPTGADNFDHPVFSHMVEVAPDNNGNFQAMAWLDSPGNLNTLHHGWVWDEAPMPTIEDGSNDLGPFSPILTAFSTSITGLELGKVYYLRPYVSTGDTTIYGDELCSFLGVNISAVTGNDIFKGMQVQFSNTTLANCTYLWEFGDDSTSEEAEPKHIYNKEPGPVTVQLTAHLGGCTVTKTLTLHILPNPFDNYFVFIPGGNFVMGCTPEQDNECDQDEEVIHPVTVPSFYMGETEITQGQWLAVMGNYPSSAAHYKLNYPVETVTWNEVQDFITKLNATLPEGAKPFRLPTEAEWEYAARGGADALSMTKYAGSDNLNLVAWHSGNSGDSTHMVKTKKENGFLLYDMSGNVYEYVEDNYHDTYNGAPQDGTAWNDNPTGTQKVIRGGGYKYDTNNCRTANRTPGDPWTKDAYTGFRLARSY